MAKEAHTDGTRVVQYQSDDQNSMKTTIMQMPMDYLEIPGPSLPRGFLELSEEARYVNVESGQSCYTEEVQSQEAGLTRPVFVTIMEDSLSVPKEEPLPGGPVGPSGPLGQDDQSVLPGSDPKDEGTDPAGPVGPDVSADQVQPVAEGPVGQYVTRSPVGPDGMLSTCDPDQPMAEGPVGRYITRSPLGPGGMFSTCDPDQPVADGPVGPSVTLRTVGPRRMFSQGKPEQPVAVGPVGQSFTPGPCGIGSMCKLDDPIDTGPVGSTEIPDPGDETERPIQIDLMKIVPTDGPESLVDTPPSSDSGIHSWGEQWENMSISTADTETEQNGRPKICSPTGGVLVTPECR